MSHFAVTILPIHGLATYCSCTALNLATRFWADVRFVFRNSGKPLRASPHVKTALSRWPKANGVPGVMLHRAYSSCRFSASSRSRTSLIKHERSSHRRRLATHSAMACASHDLSWEEEALQDMILSSSSRQDHLEPWKGVGSVRDESLRAASPLRSPAQGSPSPRFDWRRRATSRAPQRDRHEISGDRKDTKGYIKRLMPQQLDIEPGKRFHQEVKAYEDRYVVLSRLGGRHGAFPILDFYPCWSSSKPKRRRKCARGWQSGLSSDCAKRATASPGCRRFGCVQNLAMLQLLALAPGSLFRITSLSECFCRHDGISEACAFQRWHARARHTSRPSPRKAHTWSSAFAHRHPVTDIVSKIIRSRGSGMEVSYAASYPTRTC